MILINYCRITEKEVLIQHLYSKIGLLTLRIRISNKGQDY
jgi:hypothetical protein